MAVSSVVPIVYQHTVGCRLPSFSDRRPTDIEWPPGRRDISRIIDYISSHTCSGILFLTTCWTLTDLSPVDLAVVPLLRPPKFFDCGGWLINWVWWPWPQFKLKVKVKTSASYECTVVPCSSAVTCIASCYCFLNKLNEGMNALQVLCHCAVTVRLRCRHCVETAESRMVGYGSPRTLVFADANGINPSHANLLNRCIKMSFNSTDLSATPELLGWFHTCKAWKMTVPYRQYNCKQLFAFAVRAKAVLCWVWIL